MDDGSSGEYQPAIVRQDDPLASARREAVNRVRIACGAVALLLIALGLVARLWRHDLPLSDESAGIVATSLALAATLYAGVLMFWEGRTTGRS